jgi:hypothetical protein
MSKSNEQELNLHKLDEFKAPVRIGTLAERVKEISAKDIIEPNIPIGVFLQEAYNIFRFCRNDRELLIRKGLDWAIVEELPQRIEFLREAEAEWWQARFGVTPVRQEYEHWLEIATTVKKDLIHDMEYAFADSTNLLQLVATLKKGSSEEELDRDLSTLLRCAQENAPRLLAKGSDPKLVKDLEECGQKFSPLLIKFRLEEIETDSKQTDRNRAYLFCAVAVEAIRDCARYALRNDRKRLRGYLSEYFRRRSGRKAAQEPDASGQ